MIALAEPHNFGANVDYRSDLYFTMNTSSHYSYLIAHELGNRLNAGMHHLGFKTTVHASVLPTLQHCPSFSELDPACH